MIRIWYAYGTHMVLMPNFRMVRIWYACDTHVYVACVNKHSIYAVYACYACLRMELFADGALTTPLQLPEHWNWAFTATQLLLSGPGHWNLAATWLSVPQRLRPPLPHPITELPQTRLVLATV